MSWVDIAAAQDGVIAGRQLRDDGMDRGPAERLVRSGALVGITRGVYIVRGAPLTYRASLWWALLATRGVLGFGSAAHLWGVCDELPPVVHVIVGTTRRLSPLQNVRMHRCFVPASAITAREGLAVTTRTWSVLDHAGTLSLPAAQTVIDRAIQRRWVAAGDITHRLAEYPGHAGNRILRSIAPQLGDDAAVHSERVLHRILRRAGITNWVANFPVWINGALVAVVDVALVEARIALEVDGWAFHSDVERFQRDRTRQNDLTAAGWTILRFTWADLRSRPRYVAATVIDQLRRHRRSFGELASP